MKWRNTVTGLVVDTDETMPYPYERIPGSADDVPDARPAADVFAEIRRRDQYGRFLPVDADESP